MAILLSQLHIQLRQVLLDSNVFESNRTLNAVFIDARINRWHNKIPQNNSPSERVDTTIQFLLGQRDKGQNGLLLFLAVLKERTDRNLENYQLLNSLAAQIEQDIKKRRFFYVVNYSRNLALVRYGLVIVPLIVIWVWFSTRPRPMGNGFNVAIAQFDFARTDQENLEELERRSNELSTGLYQTISQTLKELPDILTFDLRGPDEIKIVTSENADKIAEQVNASILIYGHVEQIGNQYQVTLMFHVPSKEFNYGAEITGLQRLGQPIVIQQNSSNNYLENEMLSERIHLMNYLITGLAYFSVLQYDRAVAEFDAALATINSSEPIGQEVIYVLKGTAILRTYNNVCPTEESKEQIKEELTELEEEINEGINLNPNYGRSYLVLGAIKIQQCALLDCTLSDVEVAYNSFQNSINATEQPEKAFIPTKADYGLGQVYLICYGGSENSENGKCSFLDEPNYLEKAKEHFEQVVMKYEETNAVDLIWFAGHAHAQLGGIAQLEGDWETVVSENRNAIEVLSKLSDRQNLLNPYLAKYWSYIGNAQQELGNFDEAKKAYESALDIDINACAADDWQEKINQLEQ